MAYTIDDLNPADSVFKYGEKEFMLRKFDLRARVWANSEFATTENTNGLAVLSTKLENADFEAATRLSYHLLKEKSDYPTYESFASILMLDEDKDYTVLGTLFKTLTKCLGLSEKQIEENYDEHVKKQ